MYKLVAPFLFATLVLLTTTPSKAQDAVSYVIQPESKMWIDGTSNKNDWTVYATEMSGHVMRAPEASMTEPGVTGTHLVISSPSIKSRKSSIMDRLMHKALSVQSHKEVVYELKSAEVASSSDDSFTLDTLGDLTLAGVTKEIAMTVVGETTEDGKLRLTGSHTMLMSDFEIDRPTAMYGSLRTGDEVVVHFDLHVGREDAQ